MNGHRIRVLVIEDSIRLRARIVKTLSADPGIEVLAQAADGRAAIDLCLQLRPDVVTMGLLLPGITGLAATEQLMQRCPTPILISSAATDPDELLNTVAALAAGAVDVLERPRAGVTEEADWDRRLISRVKLVARIQVITHLNRRAGQRTELPEPPSTRRPPARLEPLVLPSEPNVPSIVALGASTGGPAAVATVLSGLTPDFSLPVLLVLHVSDAFGPAIASWLKGVTGRRVRLAESGEPISDLGGQVIMAPPGQHLATRHGLLVLNRERERHSCRPSVDVLFESLAAEFGGRLVACLLTGMGKDGATGLLDVHRHGGVTIAQDEASSVVFGMPGEAIRLGAAQLVLPVDEIGPALCRLAAVAVGSR